MLLLNFTIGYWIFVNFQEPNIQLEYAIPQPTEIRICAAHLNIKCAPQHWLVTIITMPITVTMTMTVRTRNMTIMMMISKGDSCHSQGISRYIIWLNQTLGLSAEDVKDSQVKQVQRAHSRLKGPTAGLLIFYQYFP